MTVFTNPPSKASQDTPQQLLEANGVAILGLFGFGIFLIAGYSDLADNFCIQNIDPEKPRLLGPDGYIVQWNKITGCVFLVGVALILTLNHIVHVVMEKIMKIEDGTPSLIITDANYVIEGIFTPTVLVLAIIGMYHVFSDRVPVECRGIELWTYKMPYLTMQLFSVCSLIVCVTIASSIIGIYVISILDDNMAV